jgi:hypothetical protein
VTCPQKSALNGIYVPQNPQQKSYLLEGGPYVLEQDKHGIWNITDGKVHHARAEYPTKSPAQAMSWVLLTTVDDARHEAARAPGMRVTDLTANKPGKYQRCLLLAIAPVALTKPVCAHVRWFAQSSPLERPVALTAQYMVG